MAAELSDALAAVLTAINTGDDQSVPKSASRLLRHAAGTGAMLVRAGHTHTTDAAAAVQVAWSRDEVLRDALWLLFHRDADWVFAGQTSDDAVAMWFLHHPADGIPVFEELPANADLQALGSSLVGMVRGEVDRPEAGAVAALTEPESDGSLQPTLGAVRVLHKANRGMVELAWIDPEDPSWTEESRWGVAVLGDKGWTIESVAYIGSMRSLLEGADLSWPTPTG